MTIIIAKNNTGSAISIEDLGIEIPGSGQRILTDTFKIVEIATSYDLKTKAISGNIIINNGTNDLNINDSIAHINFETEYEDTYGEIQSLDIKKDGSFIAYEVIDLNFTGDVSITEDSTGHVSINIINNIFGSEFSESSSDIQSSTTSSEFQQKLILTTPLLPDGKYRIGWYYEWQYTDDKNDFKGRVQINDTTTIMEHQQEPKDKEADQWRIVGGFSYYSGSGILNIDLDYCSSLNGKTSLIRKAKLEIWRVS